MTKEKIQRAEELHAQNLGYGEIAKLLNLPKETVKSALKRKQSKVIFLKNHCLICGKEFEIKTQGQKRKYCSDRCRYLAWRENHKGETRKKTKECTCLCCGKKFFAYSHKKQSFCSRQCAARYRHGH